MLLLALFILAASIVARWICARGVDGAVSDLKAAVNYIKSFRG